MGYIGRLGLRDWAVHKLDTQSILNDNVSGETAPF